MGTSLSSFEERATPSAALAKKFLSTSVFGEEKSVKTSLEKPYGFLVFKKTSLLHQA